jgi:probable phosphoglycerate mutase
MNVATHVGENFPKIKEGGNGLRLLIVPAETKDERQIQKLSQLLADVKIDFSITGDLGNSHAIAEQILKDHPQTLQLQVLQDSFPQLWHQSLVATNRKKSDRLLTTLVVARSAVIKHFLRQIFSLNPRQLWRLHLEPGTLSIIHYHDSEHPPILQAMNVSGA